MQVSAHVHAADILDDEKPTPVSARPLEVSGLGASIVLEIGAVGQTINLFIVSRERTQAIIRALQAAMDDIDNRGLSWQVGQ